MQFREMPLRPFYGLLGLGVVLLSIGLFFAETIPSVLWIFSVFIFAICSVGIASCWRKSSQDEAKVVKSTQLPVYISAGLYGIIAGFAIKNAVEHTISGIVGRMTLSYEDTVSTTFSHIISNLLQSPYEISLFFVFLLTAIPFYHGAMIFLSEASHKKPQTPKGIIIHFGCLFIQAIIFLSISFVLPNYLLVIFLFIILMIFDSVWIMISRITLRKPPLGWLPSNLFFTTALFLIIYVNWDPTSSAIILAVICLIRTLVDYFAFKDEYFPIMGRI